MDQALSGESTHTSHVTNADSIQMDPIEFQKIWKLKRKFLEHAGETPQTAEDRIKECMADRKGLENQNYAQDIKLKATTLKYLFIILIIQTGVVYLIAFFQGFHPFGFLIKDSSFQILAAATIVQTYLLVKTAVEYLFPKR
jgi:hypothetical protein